MPLKAQKIEVSEKQKMILKKLSKSTHIELHLKLRSSIILDADDGMSNTDISLKYIITRNTVRHWRKQWEKSYSETCELESEMPLKLKEQIRNVLSDEYRSGRNARFTQEQVAEIINLSLQSPESVGVPVSHWTSTSLAKKSIELGIVDSISERQVGRFLKKYGHKSTSV
jgi:putative transposase